MNRWKALLATIFFVSHVSAGVMPDRYRVYEDPEIFLTDPGQVCAAYMAWFKKRYYSPIRRVPNGLAFALCQVKLSFLMEPLH